MTYLVELPPADAGRRRIAIPDRFSGTHSKAGSCSSLRGTSQERSLRERHFGSLVAISCTITMLAPQEIEARDHLRHPTTRQHAERLLSRRSSRVTRCRCRGSFCSGGAACLSQLVNSCRVDRVMAPLETMSLSLLSTHSPTVSAEVPRGEWRSSTLRFRCPDLRISWPDEGGAERMATASMESDTVRQRQTEKGKKSCQKSLQAWRFPTPRRSPKRLVSSRRSQARSSTTTPAGFSSPARSSSPARRETHYRHTIVQVAREQGGDRP